MRNFIGTANFLAHSVALFDHMGMKHSNYANHFQMYVDYTRSSGFSGDGHTYTNSGYQAVFIIIIFFLTNGLGMMLVFVVQRL